MVEGQEFTCPTCGSHAFGTQMTEPPGTGHCHGYAQAQPLGRHETGAVTPCAFSWLRTPAEDAKVFKGTGQYSPALVTGVVPSRPGT
jgi:hypothetical protein